MSEWHADPYGRLMVSPQGLIDLMFDDADLSGVHSDGDPAFETYNKWCKTFDKLNLLVEAPPALAISPELWHAQRQENWFIPDEYRDIDVGLLLHERCRDDDQHARVSSELILFEQRGLLPLLRFLHFLVEHLRNNGVWWGVGRGSSVASYCLYLLGVHKIDSLKHALDIGEFLK